LWNSSWSSVNDVEYPERRLDGIPVLLVMDDNPRTITKLDLQDDVHASDLGRRIATIVERI
jgi:hypothetical protein